MSTSEDFDRATIAKLEAETKLIRAQTHRRMDAEIAKLIAETSKLNTENRWYVVAAASGLTLAIVVVAKLFL